MDGRTFTFPVYFTSLYCLLLSFVFFLWIIGWRMYCMERMFEGGAEGAGGVGEAVRGGEGGG
jgi:hypothetical protein